MDKLIKNDNLKIQLLKHYKMKNSSYTASYLSEIYQCKFETTRRALEFFYAIGVVEKEVKEHGENKKITYYNLTDIGRNLIKSKKL